ncbi:MAG: type II secretion system secretin GspD [Syntrophales bacterium]
MPFARTILSRPPGIPALVQRRGSVSPEARGPNPRFRAGTAILAAFAVVALAMPDTVRAVRLADEEKPVSSAPARRQVPAQPQPPPKPAERKESPARTFVGQPAAGQGMVPAGTGTPPPSSAGRPLLTNGSAQAKPAAAGNAGSGALPPAVSAPAEPSAAEKPAGPPASPAAPAKDGRYVTIDFDNVDIQVFIKFISEMTGRNFLIDEKVRGKVTVVSPKKIAVDDVYKVFESVMEIYGFATVPAGDVIKVIPAVDARGKNLDLRVSRDDTPPEDKMITQIISLQHASPDEMKKILDPLISKSSIILAYAPTGMLIITDVQSNIKRLQEIVTALDVHGVGEVISYMPLKAAMATDIAKSLSALFPPQRPGIPVTRIVPDERTNSLILLATEQNTSHVKKLVALMDKDIPRVGNMLHVYRLQNGNAEDMVKVLMNLPKETTTAARPAQAGQPAGGAKTPVLSKDMNVVADKATNTLIITADRDDYRIIESVIQKLDVPRPMVYIEALIMEVSVTKNFNIGVEWRGLRDIGNADLKGLGPNATALGMAGFTGQSIIPQINSTTGAVSMPAGFSLGVIGAGIQIGNVLFPNIGAVLQAYRNDKDVSILSTPQLLTLNNEDAEINVGQNVPYITRTDTSAVIPGQTFGSSYEYRDVGVILKITPNINEEQFVRLKIDQQVTKLADLTQTSTPTTLKRTAKTTVVIKDNETVVIGGMIDDSTSVETAQVPCVGEIPLLGWLFKTMGRGRAKTNLFVFITPHIIRNQAEAAAIYQKKLDDVGNVEEGIIKMNEARTFQKPQIDRKE